MQKRNFHNELDMLIESYLTCAEYSCSLLKQLYNGKETFLRAKILKLIPNEGHIENVKYKFHGSGCFFQYANSHIDIDFGPNDRCDGFDLFRLKDFFSEIIDKKPYLSLCGKGSFELQFEELIKAKIIHNPQLEPSPHLFFRI
jgi:hypothetical protein